MIFPLRSGETTIVRPKAVSPSVHACGCVKVMGTLWGCVVRVMSARQRAVPVLGTTTVAPSADLTQNYGEDDGENNDDDPHDKACV